LRRQPDAGRDGRPYYGWYVVGACNLVAFMTWGVGVFNQGVFIGFYVKEYGWSPAELSIGPTMLFVWAGLVGIAVGRLIDRWGPRPVLVFGALMLGAGTTALGLVWLPWQVYPAFLLLGTGYACLHTVTLGAIVSRWFVRQRARAMALATFGASIGGTFLAPLNAAILERWGGLAGGLALAAIAITVVVPLAIWVVKDGPEAVGQRIDGDTPDAADPERDVDSSGDYPWTLSEAVRTRAFWAIALSFHLTMIAQGGFLVHQVPFLQPTLGFLAAAMVVSATTIAGSLGRAAFAVVGNRWPPRQIAAAMFLLQAVGVFLSAVGTTEWMLVLGSLLFGLTMGTTIALQPVIAAECFGRRSFGRVYGPIYLAIQLGTGFGPLFFGYTAAAAGGYGPGFLVAVAGLLLATLGSRWATCPVPPARPAVAATPG
jgi:MFS family permease